MSTLVGRLSSWWSVGPWCRRIKRRHGRIGACWHLRRIPPEKRQDAENDAADEHNEESERETGHGRDRLNRRPALELENLAQEKLRTLLLGIGEEVLRCSHFHDIAISHEDDTIGDGAGEPHLVGDNDHGHAPFG